MSGELTLGRWLGSRKGPFRVVGPKRSAEGLDAGGVLTFFGQDQYLKLRVVRTSLTRVRFLRADGLVDPDRYVESMQ